MRFAPVILTIYYQSRKRLYIAWRWEERACRWSKRADANIPSTSLIPGAVGAAGAAVGLRALALGAGAGVGSTGSGATSTTSATGGLRTLGFAALDSARTLRLGSGVAGSGSGTSASTASSSIASLTISIVYF